MGNRNLARMMMLAMGFAIVSENTVEATPFSLPAPYAVDTTADTTEETDYDTFRSSTVGSYVEDNKVAGTFTPGTVAGADSILTGSQLSGDILSELTGVMRDARMYFFSESNSFGDSLGWVKNDTKQLLFELVDDPSNDVPSNQDMVIGRDFFFSPASILNVGSLNSNMTENVNLGTLSDGDQIEFFIIPDGGDGNRAPDFELVGVNPWDGPSNATLVDASLNRINDGSTTDLPPFDAMAVPTTDPGEFLVDDTRDGNLIKVDSGFGVAWYTDPALNLDPGRNDGDPGLEHVRIAKFLSGGYTYYILGWEDIPQPMEQDAVDFVDIVSVLQLSPERTIVPEPGTYAVMGSLLVAVAARRRVLA